MSRWVGPRATVLDPFCGSGTTLLEAKLSGRRSIGIDLNPLGAALARAKLQPVTLDEVNRRLTTLAEAFRGESELEDVPEKLQSIFHRRTLAQLFYLRNALSTESADDVFLRGALLGILHGKHRRNGSTAYLSVDMPNTFSMSPEYVRRFVERNALRQPPVDVFAKLRERITRLLRSEPLRNRPSADVVQGDATRMAEILSDLGIHSVGAIVTSPPYLGVLRYGAFNWIRLWLLGHDPSEVDALLQTSDSIERYLSFFLSFLGEAARVLRPGGVAVLVIGDVHEHGQELNLAERVWEEMTGLSPFELAGMHLDAYDQNTKTTRVWGDNRKGRATPRDRVLVLRRVSRERRSTNPR